MKFYEKLALTRKNYKFKSSDHFNKVNNILCQLYDVAASNNECEEELPNRFYICKVSLSQPELDKLLHEIGINAETTVVNSGGMYGDMYQVDLV